MTKKLITVIAIAAACCIGFGYAYFHDYHKGISNDAVNFNYAVSEKPDEDNESQTQPDADPEDQTPVDTDNDGQTQDEADKTDDLAESNPGAVEVNSDTVDTKPNPVETKQDPTEIQTDGEDAYPIAPETASQYANANFYIEKNLEKYISYHALRPELTADDVVQAVNTNINEPFYTDIKPTDMSKGYLMLCNKYNQLDAGYVPPLEALGEGYGDGYLEPTAAAAFRSMVDAARDDGIILFSVSPYRSYDTQNGLYWNYVAGYGQAMADTFSARAGHSEHQTGLAVDINCASGAANFQNTAEYAWLINNCHEYGFILRYLPGKEYITGYTYEPWHYRYLGPDVATEVAGLGITYEEYYAYYIDR